MASVSLTVRVADLPQTRLLLWTLMELESEMRVGADPFASRLSETLDRYQASIGHLNREDRAEEET